MLRFSLLAFTLALVLWAPWMDRQSAETLTNTILVAYGPMPSTCYDVDGKKVQEGVAVRWYPMGRLVHSCVGDFVVWFWGDVKELGGVAKTADEIHAVQSKALSCEDVLKRQEARKASTTDSELEYYDGPIAQKPNYSIFPDAAQHNNVILAALRGGVNFAGRFAVAEWECGTNCQNHAILDVQTGQVIAYGPQTEFGVMYATNTTLFITNPLSHLPALPTDPYEKEGMALSLARVERTYFRLTYDALSGTRYLVQQCVESASTGYIEVEDDRIGVVRL